MGDDSWHLENVLKWRPFPRDKTVLFVLSWGVHVLFWVWKWNFSVLTPRKAEKSQQIHLLGFSSSTLLQVVTGKGPARRRGLPAAPGLSMSTSDAQKSPSQQSLPCLWRSHIKPVGVCGDSEGKGLKNILEIIKAFTLLSLKGDKPYPCAW